MKAVIVNTADVGGGAERMAMTLLDGFEALGTETWLAVGDKRTDHPRVMPFYLSPHLDYRPHARPARRAALAVRRGLTRRLGHEDFDHPYTHRLLELTGTAPDVVLCKNLHGGYFDLRALGPLARRVPVVLSLADSWIFTGHCAVPSGCSRWERGCGSCPDLALPPAVRRDATAGNWRRKQRMLAGAGVFALAPSRWIEERARRSLLAPAVRDWRVVANGIDLGVFAPGSRREARRDLGLDPDRHVALFVANLGAASGIKDFATVRAAVRRLAEEAGRELDLLVVGGGPEIEPVGGGVRIRRVGFQAQPEAMARLYRAADVHVHSAREETFGLAAAEAMACGIPVVSASSGGIEEVVRHDRTGVLVAPGDSAALASALGGLLDDDARRARLGAAAAADAARRFDSRRMVSETHAWCVEAAERWRATRGAPAQAAALGSRP
ncbi:MAG: hypothetical protein QOE65_2205 [Solirubrobacteraceae bacterium]|nr:hypothetical protein [Solirubrobacteraceae bacterium]